MLAQADVPLQATADTSAPQQHAHQYMHQQAQSPHDPRNTTASTQHFLLTPDVTPCSTPRATGSAPSNINEPTRNAGSSVDPMQNSDPWQNASLGNMLRRQAARVFGRASAQETQNQSDPPQMNAWGNWRPAGLLPQRPSDSQSLDHEMQRPSFDPMQAQRPAGQYMQQNAYSSQQAESSQPNMFVPYPQSSQQNTYVPQQSRAGGLLADYVDGTPWSTSQNAFQGEPQQAQLPCLSQASALPMHQSAQQGHVFPGVVPSYIPGVVPSQAQAQSCFSAQAQPFFPSCFTVCSCPCAHCTRRCSVTGAIPTGSAHSAGTASSAG